MDSLLFPFSEYAWVYGAFIALVAALLALDLGVFHRKAHAVSFKEAASWTVFWISLSLTINYLFYLFARHRFSTDPAYLAIPNFDAQAEATRIGFEFLTGFVIEKALAIDNIFVFVVVFSTFRIPPLYQHRVLFFGIGGALFFRAIFIALGAKLMAYQWVVAFFGVFLVITGLKLLFTKTDHANPTDSFIVRFLRKHLRLTDTLHGQQFFVMQNGVRHATPLLAALCFMEVTDIVFAVDSVPAIFAVTREPLVVFISNILAVMGLRSLYFMLAGSMDRFVYLKIGLALVLVFVGLKMTVLTRLMGGHFPITLSLGIIATLIVGSVVASLIATRKPRAF